MAHHRVIWYITGAVVLGAALVFVARHRAREDAAAPSPRAGGNCTAVLLKLLKTDPAVDKPQTKAAVARAAQCAKELGLDTAEGYYAQALAAKERKSFAEAESAYRQAIARKPGWSWPYNGLGVLLANHTPGRSAEAEEAFRTAIRLDPAWSRPHNDLAILLRITGRLEEAEKEAKIALRYGPEQVASHNNYANLLVVQGKLEAAAPYYRRAIELDPDHPKPYYNLACLFSLQGRLEDAYPLLEKAFRLAPALRAEARKDPDLNALRAERRFQRLLRPPGGE